MNIEKLAMSLHNIITLYANIFGTGSYYAYYQRENINTNTVTDSLIFTGVLSVKYAHSVVAQIMWD